MVILKTSEVLIILLEPKQPPLSIVYIMACTNTDEYDTPAEDLPIKTHDLFIGDTFF